MEEGLLFYLYLKKGKNTEPVPEASRHVILQNTQHLCRLDRFIMSVETYYKAVKDRNKNKKYPLVCIYIYIIYYIMSVWTMNNWGAVLKAKESTQHWPRVPNYVAGANAKVG